MTNMPKVIKENAEYKIIGTFEGDKKEALKIANLVIKKDGTIRASKPKVTDDPLTGKAAYVWRMVCFSVSPKPAHHCMPVCANFDLPAYDENGKWKCEISRKMEKELDKIADAIIDCVPKTQWHGIQRWGKAFGF